MSRLPNDLSPLPRPLEAAEWRLPALFVVDLVGSRLGRTVRWVGRPGQLAPSPPPRADWWQTTGDQAPRGAGAPPAPALRPADRGAAAPAGN